MRDFIVEQKNNLWYGSFPNLTSAGFINACSCRLHGESDIAFGTLNLALHVGDDKAKVLANRSAFAAALGVQADSFTACAQVHGSKIVRITEKMAGSGALDVADTVADTDALITDLPNVPLLLFYADCVPVLLADKVSGAIGLAHAGWRGTVAEIVAKAVDAMVEQLGANPANILAAIGPSIGACCYEVDDFVFSKAPEYKEFFTPNSNGRYQMDLWGINKKQLLDKGLLPQHIAVAGVCTAHNAELFCSYRAEQGKTGRMGVCLCRPAEK